MKEITVTNYSCDICHRNHKTKTAAIKCELKCKNAQLKSKEILDLKNNCRLLSTSPDDFARRLTEYSKSIGEHVDVKFIGLSYTENASNAHSCPIGCVINWNRDEEKPRGYPALRGKVSMIKNNKSGKYCSDIFRTFSCSFPGFNIGCGGGSYNSEYEITLWLSDFPLWGQIYNDIHNKQIEIAKFREHDKQIENLLHEKTHDVSSTDEKYIQLKEEISRLEEKENEVKNEQQKRFDELKKQLSMKSEYAITAPLTYKMIEQEIANLNSKLV